MVEIFWSPGHFVLEKVVEEAQAHNIKDHMGKVMNRRETGKQLDWKQIATSSRKTRQRRKTQ